MTHAIRLHATGGPEVLQWEEISLPAPGPGEALVRHTAVGLNFIDIYFRSGLYPMPLPNGLGLEGAGVVEAVGEGVNDLTIGDRVAYGTGPLGAYAEARVMPAQHLVKLPDGISDQQAAAMMLQGMTARYLLRQTYAVQPGDTIVMHAAAGGVGLILCQWAKALGVTVIGTVSTPAKADLARAHGCDHVVISGQDDLVATVKSLTGGKGVPVVYDGVGKDTFITSLNCLRPRGLMVSFGNASGPVPPVDMKELASRGSLFLTRPSLFHYTSDRAELVENANDLFDVVMSGKVKIPVNQTYALRDAAQAQIDLAGRKTTGSTLLLP